MFVDVAIFCSRRTAERTDRHAFSAQLNANSLLHEDMRRFFDHFPQARSDVHSFDDINAMAAFYPTWISSRWPTISTVCARVISSSHDGAFAYKKSIGKPVIYPRHTFPTGELPQHDVRLACETLRHSAREAVRLLISFFITPTTSRTAPLGGCGSSQRQ